MEPEGSLQCSQGPPLVPILSSSSSSNNNNNNKIMKLRSKCVNIELTRMRGGGGGGGNDDDDDDDDDGDDDDDDFNLAFLSGILES
jgi:hypothetical protein